MLLLVVINVLDVLIVLELVREDAMEIVMVVVLVVLVLVRETVREVVLEDAMVVVAVMVLVREVVEDLVVLENVKEGVKELVQTDVRGSAKVALKPVKILALEVVSALVILAALELVKASAKGVELAVKRIVPPNVHIVVDGHFNIKLMKRLK